MKLHSRLSACLLLLGSSFALSTSARAHDPGLSTSVLRLDGERVSVVLTINDLDLEELVEIDQDGDGRASAREVKAARAVLQVYWGRHTKLTVDGGVAALDSWSFDLDEHDDVRIRAVAHVPAGARLTWSVEALAELPRGHRHLASIEDSARGTRRDALLHAKTRKLSLKLDGTAHDEGSTGSSLFVDFVVLGIEHILIGWDHLVFVLLLILGSTLRRSFVLLTAFTVAHSITLGLASLDLVRLPSRVVEFAIAASIVALAVENFREPRDARATKPALRPLLLCFAFGLLHGFGFAGVLADFLPATDPLLPLLAFNCGVELGQVAVAALFFALLHALNRIAERPRIQLAGINLVAFLLGAWWMLERSVL